MSEATRQFVLTVFDDAVGRSLARRGIPLDKAIDPNNKSHGAEVARFAYHDELKTIAEGKDNEAVG